MSKTFSGAIILWMTLSMVGGLYTIKNNQVYKERQVELDNIDFNLDKRIAVFEKVSDPNSIRLYVKQLNDLLDDMTTLSKMLDNGQLIDEALVAILNKQQKINKQLGDMITKDEFVGYIAKAKNRDESLGYHVDELWEWTFLKEETDSTSTNSIINKLNLIQTDLDTIRSLIKEIEDSKIGRKIFK